MKHKTNLDRDARYVILCSDPEIQNAPFAIEHLYTSVGVRTYFKYTRNEDLYLFKVIQVQLTGKTREYEVKRVENNTEFHPIENREISNTSAQ